MGPSHGGVAVKDEFTTRHQCCAGKCHRVFHGYTYSAHPAACAAGIATQKIYEDEGLFDRANDMSAISSMPSGR